MEEKTATTASAPLHQHGCFVCTTAIPLLERMWSDATKDHFRNSRIEFLKGHPQPARRPDRTPLPRRAERHASHRRVAGRRRVVTTCPACLPPYATTASPAYRAAISLSGIGV